MSAPGPSGDVRPQAGERPPAVEGARATITELTNGFLGAALGGLILAGWAVRRYTIRWVPRALRE